TYRDCLVWDKMRMGMGYWLRIQTELVLVGTRGHVTPPPEELREDSVLRAPRGKHSEKPEQVRPLIERWSPEPRLELFGRRAVPGRTVFGNEVERDLFTQVVMNGGHQ